MLLALAILVLVITGIGTLLVLYANMMSDAPSEDEMNLWPAAGGVVLSVALFVAWWFYGGTGVTW